MDIRPIEFNEKGITLSKWLSSDTWYQKNTTEGKVFFMVEHKGIEEMYQGMSKLNMPEPIEEFQFGLYTIFVFEKNPLYVQRAKVNPRKKKRIMRVP